MKRRYGGIRGFEMNQVPANVRARIVETELREKSTSHTDTRRARGGTALPSEIRSPTLPPSPSPSAGKYDSELYYARRSPSDVAELSRESGM